MLSNPINPCQTANEEACQTPYQGKEAKNWVWCRPCCERGVPAIGKRGGKVQRGLLLCILWLASGRLQSQHKAFPRSTEELTPQKSAVKFGSTSLRSQRTVEDSMVLSLPRWKIDSGSDWTTQAIASGPRRAGNTMYFHSGGSLETCSTSTRTG